MNNELRPLTRRDSFSFSCHPQVACFNECCRDLNQILTPYDILRLKTHLGLSSRAFLDQYTCTHTGPKTGLPVISLKPAPHKGLECPFVTRTGCSVYQNRPSSCRIYPLVRVARRSRETGRISESFALMREAHCGGFHTEASQTVSEWLVRQGLDEYHDMNDRLMDIISIKNRMFPGPLDQHSVGLIHMALYDLDTFRTHIYKRGLPDRSATHSAPPRQAEFDDAALLIFGIKWIKQTVFDTHGDI